MTVILVMVRDAFDNNVGSQPAILSLFTFHHHNLLHLQRSVWIKVGTSCLLLQIRPLLMNSLSRALMVNILLILVIDTIKFQ